MRVGFISTRLAGTDGVSLETAKVAAIVRRLGHEVYYCVGELEDDGPPGLLVSEMHFAHPQVQAIHDEAFLGPPSPDLRMRVEALAAELRDAVGDFVAGFGIDLLFPQNALAIPMHLPLGLALADYVEATSFPTVAHHHDFAWERARFAHPRATVVEEVLARAFPPDLPSVRHLVINSIAQGALLRRCGIRGEVLPNIFDYAHPPEGPDAFVEGMWEDLGLPEGALVILQPTRVVPRKGIESALDLVARLDEPGAVLVISHHAGDEGLGYLEGLRQRAEGRGVDLRYLAHRFAPERSVAPDGTKTYSLWDAYRLADFVTYPSRVEGFGNAFLEAVYFRLPLLVNRYPVYDADLRPLGFRCVELEEGVVTPEAVAGVRRLLEDEALRRDLVEHNYAVARTNFSFEAVLPLLAGVLQF
jgi:glycosyltransferase involved in cell wall biosynthesis